MTTTGSRWANVDDDAEIEAARKREKEEKKRRKEEKLRKAQEQAQASSAHAQNRSLDSDDRPTKRRRLSNEEKEVDHEEGAHLLEFPHRGFGPSRDIALYEFINNIEEGSYGMVSRARNKETGEVVALKRLKMDHASDGFPVTGLREIQTLKACQHHNVVNLREVVVGEDLKDVYLVMDFLEHDLKTLLEDISEPFLPSETKTLMLQLVAGTEYLHSNWILHRDLKTSNLLLNNRGELKLADFGMARYTGNPPPRLTQLVVTLWYRSPELLLGADEYSFEIDVWSIGCIFAELLTREPLFSGKNEVDQLSKIFNLLGVPTKGAWPEFRSLPNAKALHPLLSTSRTASGRQGIASSRFPYLTASGLQLLNACLSLNPANRPTATEILSHAYFREDPRPKAKEMFPTFPSKAGQEKRRRKATPQAPDRGQAPKLNAQDFAGIFDRHEDEEQGAGFALRLG